MDAKTLKAMEARAEKIRRVVKDPYNGLSNGLKTLFEQAANDLTSLINEARGKEEK